MDGWMDKCAYLKAIAGTCLSVRHSLATETQSSNQGRRSLGHLLTGFHWEQDGRPDSNIHPSTSFVLLSLPLQTAYFSKRR